MRDMSRSLIALLLSILMPAASLAATPGAMVYAKGSGVLLNGTVAPDSSALFAGDRISTSTTSAVNVVLQGSSVVVDPQSTLVYGDNFFDLSAGGASVTTSSQMQGRSGGVTVTPAAPVETRYRMVQKDGNLLVAALAGSVRVVDHGTETLVSAGYAMSFAGDQPDQEQPNQSNRRRRGAIPPPAGTTNAPILLGVAVAGAAVAIVLLTTRGGCQPVSPTGTC